MDESCHVPKVLSRVKQINDLNGAWKVFIGDIPDPFGTVAYNHFLCGKTPPAIPGFSVEPFAEIAGDLDGAGISSRIRVADRETFLIPSCLGEDASQFDFPGVSWLAFHLALSTFRLGNRHSCTVHLDVQDGNGLAHYHGKIQLHGLLDLFPFACGYVFANGFRGPLYRFGGYLQAGEQFHLLATLLKRRSLADHGQHTTHSWRQLQVLNIQFNIGRELADMTVRTQVVGTRYDCAANRRENLLGTYFLVVR